MIYIYASLLLHKAGKQLNEAGIKKVLEAAGVHPEETRVKALVAALEGVDIEKAIAEAAIPVASAAPKAETKAEPKKEEKKEDKSEQAAAGLGLLFA